MWFSLFPLPLHLTCTPMDLARISEPVLNLHCICADLAEGAVSTRAGPAGRMVVVMARHSLT